MVDGLTYIPKRHVYMYKSSLFSIPLIAFVAFGFLDDGHSDLNEKEFQYSFNLHTI